MSNGFEVTPGRLDEELVLYAGRGNEAAVKALLLAGAKAKFRNSEALYDAAKRGHISVVELLLAAGADPRAVKNRAFVGAVRNAKADVVEMLLEAGADPSVEDWKWLIVAARNNDWRTTQTILLHVEEPTRGTRQAIEEALSTGAKQAYDILLGWHYPERMR